METIRISATNFKRHSGALLDRVKHTPLRVVVKKRGEDFAILEGIKKTPKKEITSYRGKFKGIGKYSLTVKNILNKEISQRLK